MIADFVWAEVWRAYYDFFVFPLCVAVCVYTILHLMPSYFLFTDAAVMLFFISLFGCLWHIQSLCFWLIPVPFAEWIALDDY